MTISILDNDFYKFTMQQAIFKHYKQEIPVVYEFTNRKPARRLNAKGVAWLKNQILELEKVVLTEKEREFLLNTDTLDKDYVDYLTQYRFRPQEQVQISFDSETEALALTIHGSWLETILYEVPLLALVSESYYLHVDLDWHAEGQEALAREKARALFSHGCDFLELGTRRRRDLKTQETVIRAIQEEEGNHTGRFLGTSNVYLSMKYKTGMIGTIAHEFFMAISALEGLAHANENTLKIWQEVYGSGTGVVLTDTFTTDVFLQDFGYDLASAYGGVRQDSGDPFQFAVKMVDHYKSLGIDPSTKRIVFSDGLNVALAIKLKDHADKLGIPCSFGIGTNLTNDFQKKSNPEQKSQSLSIVIKLKECAVKRVVKLSDDPGKHSADKETIQAIQQELGIQSK